MGAAISLKKSSDCHKDGSKFDADTTSGSSYTKTTVNVTKLGQSNLSNDNPHSMIVTDAPDWLLYSILDFCDFRTRLNAPLIFPGLLQERDVFWSYLCERLAEERCLTLLPRRFFNGLKIPDYESYFWKLWMRRNVFAGSIESSNADLCCTNNSSTAFLDPNDTFLRKWAVNSEYSTLTQSDLERIMNDSTVRQSFPTVCRFRPASAFMVTAENTKENKVTIPLHQRVVLLRQRMPHLSKSEAQQKALAFERKLFQQKQSLSSESHSDSSTTVEKSSKLQESQSLNTSEESRYQLRASILSHSKTEIFTLSPGVGAKKFEFDSVLDNESQQCDVFEQVLPLINRFMNGEDASVFCYGQTGAGKTHTMFGPSEHSKLETLETHYIDGFLAEQKSEKSYFGGKNRMIGLAASGTSGQNSHNCADTAGGQGVSPNDGRDQKLINDQKNLNQLLTTTNESEPHLRSEFSNPLNFGIIPLSMLYLLARKPQLQNAVSRVSLRFSYIEIFGNQCRDLLEQNASVIGSLVHPKAIEIELESARDIHHALVEGQKNKRKAATKMNESSTRAHSVAMIKLFREDLDPNIQCQGSSHTCRLSRNDLNDFVDRLERARDIEDHELIDFVQNRLIRNFEKSSYNIEEFLESSRTAESDYSLSELQNMIARILQYSARFSGIQKSRSNNNMIESTTDIKKLFSFVWDALMPKPEQYLVSKLILMDLGGSEKLSRSKAHEAVKVAGGIVSGTSEISRKTNAFTSHENGHLLGSSNSNNEKTGDSIESNTIADVQNQESAPDDDINTRPVANITKVQQPLNNFNPTSQTVTLQRNSWADYYKSRERVTETAYINLGLLSLKRCIVALLQQDERINEIRSHPDYTTNIEKYSAAIKKIQNEMRIPFYDSKLTQIMRESMENRNMICIVCAAIEDANAIESISSLRFGEECRKLAGNSMDTRTGDGVKKEENKDLILAIKSLDSRIASLQQVIKSKEKWEWRETERVDVVTNPNDISMTKLNENEEMELGGLGAVEFEAKNKSKSGTELDDTEAVKHTVWSQVIVGAEEENKLLEQLTAQRRMILGES